MSSSAFSKISFTSKFKLRVLSDISCDFLTSCIVHSFPESSDILHEFELPWKMTLLPKCENEVAVWQKKIEIFKNYFMKKIPNKLRMLSFNKNGKLSKSYREIINVFLDMIIDSAYFAYAKKDFYDELKKMVTNLEDKLIAKANNAVLELEQQKDFIYSVQEDTKNIVKLVNKN